MKTTSSRRTSADSRPWLSSRNAEAKHSASDSAMDFKNSELHLSEGQTPARKVQAAVGFAIKSKDAGGLGGGWRIGPAWPDGAKRGELPFRPSATLGPL